jgi:hypothetical protein
VVFEFFPSFSLCTLSVLVSAILSLLYNIHNTKIHASGRIRTRNPSKRQAQTLGLNRWPMPPGGIFFMWTRNTS